MPRRVITFARRFFWRAAGIATVLVASNAVAADKKEWREVKEPHYGEVLFDFYQQKYFSALGHLMTSQHFERLGQHADDAELLRGGGRSA